jgi:transcriptional regulator with XRE-family HTH domain
LVTKEENIRLIFGLKIRQLRIDQHLSQAEVAQKAGISVSYLNEIEKGKKYPKANKIAALATALQVSYDWLVSLQLNQKLAPLAEIINSDILASLPLEMFGIDMGQLIDLISNTPTKVSAFISTLIEIARDYDMSVERFYFSVLRSYQEMHENYFDEIESAAIQCRRQFFGQQSLITPGDIELILSDKLGYQIDNQTMQQFESLKSLRSVFVPGQVPRLLLNPTLNEGQRSFALARELGYAWMQITDRANTFAWIKLESFEQLLNNFKASYFASALLIPRDPLVAQMQQFFQLTKWNEQAFLAIMQQYGASPEMFLYRLTNIAPRFLGMPNLFFLRFHHQRGTSRFLLNKELHLAGLHNPHSSMVKDNYCRRWVAIHALQDLEKLQAQVGAATQPMLCKVQRSQYFDSQNEYFCISLAGGIYPTPRTNRSVTIGLLMNDSFRKSVKFWDDPAISVKQVGVACERCAAENCQERVAEPVVLLEKQKSQQMQDALSRLTQTEQPG